MIKDIETLNSKLLYSVEYCYQDIITLFKYTLVNNLKMTVDQTTK